MLAFCPARDPGPRIKCGSHLRGRRASSLHKSFKWFSPTHNRCPRGCGRRWRTSSAPARQPAPPATKTSATAPLISIHHTGQPVWSPRDYASFAREGSRNPVVYRAVRMIAEAAASVPLRLFEGEAEIAAHPLLDLLAQPNAAACGPDLLEDWYGYLIAGNAYMEAVSVGGAVRELHVLRPDRMKVVAGGDGWPEAYEYTANRRHALPLRPRTACAPSCIWRCSIRRTIITA